MYKLKNNIFFINGDFIDNVYIKNNKVITGDKEYSKKEISLFLSTTKKYLSNGSKLLLNYGAGHDFSNLEYIESLTKQKHYGIFKWGGLV